MSELPKRALNQPLKWLKLQIEQTQDESVKQQILAVRDQLAPGAQELDSLRSSMQATSRQIGAARKQGEDCQELLASMQRYSSQAESLQADMRQPLLTIQALCSKSVVPKVSDASAIGDRNSENSDIPDNNGRPAYFHELSAVSGESAVEVAIDSDDKAYAEYVSTHPARTLYHDLRWRDVITQHTGQGCHYFIARRSDENQQIVGVLPVVELSSRLFGHFLISMPWFNYGGPLADSQQIAEALLQAVDNYGQQRACKYVEIRETAPRNNCIEKTHKVSMTLKLPATPAVFLSQLDASVRSQSKRAEREAASCRFSGVELLDDFYRVFSTKMRDLGTPVHSRQFYRAILEQFPEQAFLAVVYFRNLPVATGFLLAHGETLEIPWASSLVKYNSQGCNMYLYRQVLSEAIGRGYRYFDFGRSSPGSPTWRFKKQWGAVEQPLYWHYWGDASPDNGGLSPDNPKYRLAINAWQRMPVGLTTLLGPRLIRGIP